ncbi:MAG TPA: hypothetical protein VGU23_00720 [Acidobacteriaceae bacterium]|nr:hypothetical protein [Acidobacteriaceae bacterium]
MARELESEMLRRLQDTYGAMSDAKLRQMAAKPDDLTDAAREVLRGEMTRRRLEPAHSAGPFELHQGSETFGANRFAALTMRPTWGEPESGAVRSGWVSLMIFYDAIELGRACDFLEAEQIEFDIRDLSRPRSAVEPFQRPVEMDLDVRRSDQQRAISILREKMGLFPLQEVAVADAPLDDGTVATLGSFGRRADAEDVARVLEQAGMWHRIVPNEEGTAQTEDCFQLQVREIDLIAAGELVEKTMDLPEA